MMDTQALLTEWQEVLQRDAPLGPEDSLADIEEWDSLSQLGMAAFFDRRLGLHVSAATIAGCRTVQDLLTLVGQA